jgi:hypothetical protein
MKRPIAIVGAPSSIGIRPYDTGEARRLDRAPGLLRQRQLVERPAADSPEPGGPTAHDIVGLLRPLVRHPRALGLELTIYDPALDADGSRAARLVTLLEALLADGSTASAG